MADDRCRITVIGNSKKVDVAVPAWAPVGDYVGRLVQACGLESDQILPEAWSLAPAGLGPVPLAASLADAGVVDGQRLYLRDIVAGETDEPVVDDVDELVSQHMAQHGSLHGAARAVAAAALGIGWLVLTVLYFLWSGRTGALGDGPAAGLVIAGMLLPATAWVLRRRAVPVPDWLRLLMALAAVPCVAGAGVLLVAASGTSASIPIVAVFGANIGGLVALTAIPDVLTLTVQILAGVAAAVVLLLNSLHAGAVPAAGVVTLTGLIMLAVAPRAAAALAGSSFGTPAVEKWSPESVALIVARTRRLLTVITMIALGAMTIALPELAGAGDPFALALAGVAGLALLTRARDFTFAIQAVPIGAVGLLGVFVALAEAPAVLNIGGWVAPVLVVVGMAIVAAGVCFAVVAAGRPDTAEQIDLDRHSWPEIAALICNLATVPLVLALFGVFGMLSNVGGHL